MIRRPNYKKNFLPLSFIVLLVLVYTIPAFQRTLIRWVEVPVGSTIYAVQRGVSSLLDGMATVWHGYVRLVDVQQENETLRQAIGQLHGENNRLKEQSHLLERLQGLLAYKAQIPYPLITASVMGRDATQWFHTIMIDRGAADGVSVNAGVISPAGVVGKVIKVSRRYSQVLLVTDRNSVVAGIVQRTRDEGLIQGLENETLQIKYLPHFATVTVGDVLVTSGLEGSFTKGLKIGKVEQVEKKEHELFLRVKVSPEVDFNRLEEVFVLTVSPESEADVLREHP